MVVFRGGDDEGLWAAENVACMVAGLSVGNECG